MTATEKNLDSTPAFPKGEFYKTELEYVEEHGYYHYIEEFEKIKKGARPTPLWYLFLKKEILKKKKIKDEDIRQILCTDPCFNRIGLCFEQHQNTIMKDNTVTRHGQCGWSPFEGGWEEVLRRLEKPGNKYIEMDWSRYDGTIPEEVFKHIKATRFSFLSKEYQTKENRDIYKWYCRNLMHRYVILPSGEITRQERGNPSGQVSTTMDNNMVNTFLQAFEFIHLNNLDIEEAKKQWENCDTIVYGDDRVTSVTMIPPDYETKVVQMYEEIFGMWVKPENVKVFDNLNTVSFCGFTNTVVKGRYLPVPTNVSKLVASVVTPTKKLPDASALYGKILSMKVLMHNLPDSDKGKQFILECELALRKHMAMAGQPLVNFTDNMLDFLWRGGPKVQ
uniref:Non-structural polyprotein 1AB n=1 Tax=Coleura bat astrovirus TaxID=3141863 RepID=A0AAU7E141_9VIRU